MSETSSLISRREAAVAAAVRQEVVENVVPAFRHALAIAAASIAQKFHGGAIARYAASELIIQEVADLLTLSDTSELKLISPALLADTYVRDWFEGE